MQAPKETIPSDTADELDEHIRRLSDILSSMARRCSSIMSTLDRMSTAYDMLSAVNYDPDPAPACDVDALLNPEDAIEHIRETNSLLDARKYIEDGIIYLEGVSPHTSERWVVSTRNGETWCLTKDGVAKVLNLPGTGVYTRILDILQLVKEGRDDEIHIHPDDQENIADADEVVDKYQTLLERLGTEAATRWLRTQEYRREHPDSAEENPGSPVGSTH